MSSEGSRTSSSSRLSQFGLYRTIDARTEEFLKLSKKRQIRRGCACAVISTAITITVVVAVILVYEYNSSLDIKYEKESLKCINTTKSAKGKIREEHKENIKSHTINLSTVKLLNLLLRALNHTPNFENQMEDNPTTDKLVSAEPDIPFERNVFSNTKNWIRIPSLRMLAAEHKDPSIFSYRNPTSNVKLTPKARNTPPYFEMDLHSEELLEKTTKSSFRKKYQAIAIQSNPNIESTTAPPTSHKPIQVHCPDTDGQNKNCNCKKLNVFMCRLLSNIQEMFPEIILNTTLCIANNTGAEKAKKKALKPILKNKVTKTNPVLPVSKKNGSSTSNYGIKIFDKTTVQYNIATETVTEKNQNHLDITTVQFTAMESSTAKYQNNLDKTTKNSVYSNKTSKQDAGSDNSILQSTTATIQSTTHTTTKQPNVTTTAVRTYVLSPDVVEYTLTPPTTTTPYKIGSQYKTAEKIQATKSLEYEFELVDTNKPDDYNQEHFVKNRNKITDETKSKIHHKIADKQQEPVTIDYVSSNDVVTVDIYKKYQKYSSRNTNKLSNVNNSGHQHSVQNKRPKVFLKGQIQPVTTTSTTTTAKPYILAPEVVKHIEPYIKPTTRTTTSTVASATEQNNIDYKLDIEKEFERMTESTIKPLFPSRTAKHSVDNKNKIDYKLDIEKEFERMTESTIKPMFPSSTAKHFIDNPYVSIRPFNKIKFARFDSFAANPNKRVKLPLYKDINFDLFPIYKRHNAPKFDSFERIKDDNLVNSDNLNNSGTEFDLTDASSSSNKNDDVSNLNILPMNSSKSNKDISASNGILAIKMMNDSSEETTKEEDERRESETIKINNLPKSSSIEEKHAIWTYTIDNDYDDNKTKNTVDNDIKQSETHNEPMKKIILFDNTIISKSESTERTVSISQLYDADESRSSFVNYLSRITTKKGDKHQLNNTFHTAQAKFFEDKIQEKLRSHMDTTSKANDDPDNTKSVIPIEVLVDETKYNPLSMLPKSRPSYLEINRNFLSDDYEPDYLINRENSKQKRQDYDIVFDLYE